MDMLKHPGMADMPELLEKLDALRKEGKKIVFTNGCYDILHPGHVDLLERCKAQGDVLVLGLNSDESVKRQGKGDDRPVNPYPVRAFVLAHLESVDFVVRFDEDTPAKLIEAVQPDVLVKGGDWSVDRIVGRESVQRRGGEVISLPLLQGYSTTALIEKIRRTAPGSRGVSFFLRDRQRMKKGLFHALTAAAYPFGAYVLLPAITRGVGTVGDPMGRGLSRGFAALFFMGFWTLCVLIVSLTGSKAQYGECLTSVVVNAFAIVLTTLLCQLI